MTVYVATIDRPGSHRSLRIDTGWREDRERYGWTAAEIATCLAGDYPDAWAIEVEAIENPRDHATIARRAPAG